MLLPDVASLPALTFFASPPFAPSLLAVVEPPPPPEPPVAAPETGDEVAFPPLPLELLASPPIALASPELSPPLALALPFPSFLPEVALPLLTATFLASPDVLSPVEPPSPPMVTFLASPDVLEPESPPLALALVVTLPLVLPDWLTEPPDGSHVPPLLHVSAEPVFALPLTLEARFFASPVVAVTLPPVALPPTEVAGPLVALAPLWSTFALWSPFTTTLVLAVLGGVGGKKGVANAAGMTTRAANAASAASSHRVFTDTSLLLFVYERLTCLMPSRLPSSPTGLRSAELTTQAVRDEQSRPTAQGPALRIADARQRALQS